MRYTHILTQLENKPWLDSLSYSVVLFLFPFLRITATVRNCTEYRVHRYSVLLRMSLSGSSVNLLESSVITYTEYDISIDNLREAFLDIMTTCPVRSVPVRGKSIESWFLAIHYCLLVGSLPQHIICLSIYIRIYFPVYTPLVLN